MAYDGKLANRIRRALMRRRDVEERAMFGGLAFMVRGHMCCGVLQSRLVVRIDPEKRVRWLLEPGARPMDFTGRRMRGFLYVDGQGIATAAALRKWLARSLRFVESLPQKHR